MRSLFLALCAVWLLGCDDDSSTPSAGDAGPTDSMVSVDAVTPDMATAEDATPPMDAMAAPDASEDAGSNDAGSDDAGSDDAGSDDADVSDATIELDSSFMDMDPIPEDGGLGDADIADAEVVNCVPPASQFEFVVWPTTFEGNCTQCHLPGEFAQQSGSRFIVHNVENPDRESRADALAFNLEQVLTFAQDEDGNDLLIAKGLGQLGHAGGARFQEGSPEHNALLDLYDLVERAEDPDCVELADDVPGYRDIVNRLEIMTPEQTFRSFTVQVLGRLPHTGEIRQIRSGQRNDDPRLGANPGNNQQPGAEQGDNPRLIEASANSQLRTVHALINELLTAEESKTWLKDMWNDVFMFRGIHAQELERPFQVFNPHDYGSSFWSDLCGIETFLTDDEGNFIVGPGRQMLCNLEYERYGYTEVIQPNPTNNNDAGGQAVLSSLEACNYCAYTRRGIANLMLYGAVEEPLELIAHTIQSGRPFTEILTTEDIMMNYYTSLVYFGTADPRQNDFTADMDDVPVVPGLNNGPNWVRFEVDLPDHRHFKRLDRMRRTHMVYDRQYYDVVDENGDPVLDGNGEPTTDFGNIRYTTYQSERNPNQPDSFPRAGILTSTAFMTRFTSNEFNLHRHRAWQALRLLLDYDILENQGERISLADVDDPNGGVTMNNPDCESCHNRLDPIAGLFKDFYTAGHSRRADLADTQWPDIIHSPGWPDLDSQESEVHDRAIHGPPIQFLAQRIAGSPRFARTMVGYAWKQVMGSDITEVSGDPADDNFEARNTLLIAQDRFFDGLVNGFVARNYDMNFVYARLFTSQWYGIKGLREAGREAIPDEVYSDVGRAGTITPEEYFRRIEALFGEPWPMNAVPLNNTRAGTEEEQKKRDFFTRTDSAFENFDLHLGMIDSSFASFFGGIDFQNSLTRAEQINSVMSLLARRVANEFACLVVYDDLQKQQDARRFFTLFPFPIGRGAEVEQADVRANLVHLFKYFLDLDLESDDPEIDVATDLWNAARQSVLDEIAADPQASRLMAHCQVHGSEIRGDRLPIANDQDGVVRAWMTVVTYLMLQPELLQR